MKMPACQRCGGTPKRDIRPMELAYRSFTVTVDMPGWFCACGESSHSGKDMTVSDRMLNTLKARVEGLLEPSRIRKIRTGLKLSQRKAGEIIGGGPNAFHEYEKGDVLVSRALNNVLLVLERDPGMLNVII